MPNPPFVPFGKPKTSWEPLVRESRPVVSRPEPTRAPDPPVSREPVAVVSAESKLQAQIRAEFEAKESARVKEHAAIMAKLQQQQQELAAQQQQLILLCQQATEARKKLLIQFREGAGTLIEGAVRQIAGQAVQTQSMLLEQMVEEAIAALGRQELVLRVSARDAEFLSVELKDSGIRIEIDSEMSGGLRASSPAGSIDASMETAFAAIAAVIDHWKKAND